MGDIISEEKFKELKEKYLDKPGLSDAAVEEIRELYRESKYSKEIFEKLFTEISNYRTETKSLSEKLAYAWFAK
jgi:hypothetical protein